MNQATSNAVSAFDAASAAYRLAAQAVLDAVAADVKASGQGTALKITPDRYGECFAEILVVGAGAPRPLYEIDDALHKMAEPAALVLAGVMPVGDGSEGYRPGGVPFTVI